MVVGTPLSTPALPPGLGLELAPLVSAPAARLQDLVRRQLGAWRRIGAPRHVLRWLSEGVRAEWLHGPPAPFHFGISTFTPEERVWLSSERDRCLDSGAWRRATCLNFVSRAFIVTHKGKRRLVIDFRHVNLHHVKRGCRFETLQKLRRMARRGDYMFSIDLKDAYHHVGVHKADQDYFTFALQTAEGTQYFSTSALSFGWTMSPWYFTQVMKPVVSYFRNPAIGQPARFGQRLPGPLQGWVPPEASPPPTIHTAPLCVASLSSVGLLPPSEVALQWGASTAPPSLNEAEVCGLDGALQLPRSFPPGLGLDPPPFGAMLPMPVPPSPVVPHISPPLDVCCDAELIFHTMSEDACWEFEEQLQAGLSWPQIDLGVGLAWHGESRTDAELMELSDEALADEEERLLRLDVATGRQRPPPPPPPPPTRSHRRRQRRRQQLWSLQPTEVGCRVLPWLDDFAFFKQGTHAKACAERDHVFGTLESLGLQRNVTKGQPEPSHFLEDHLGYGIDTARGLFLLTSKREVKLRSMASRLLSYAARHRRFVPTRELAGFAGLGQASALAVPMARFWLRSAYDDIAEQGHRWSGLTRLSRQTMADIAKWRGLRDSRHVGRAIWRPADSAVGHVDAGPYGWGG
jgi:hypothetical protein